MLSIILGLSTASATQHEIKSMTEIDGYVEANTLVVFDIDNTLAESSQTIGSVQWQEYELEKAKKVGLSPAAALERSLRKFIAVSYVNTMRPVESLTPKYVEMLQNRGAKVMALTARPAELLARTKWLLKNIGIDLGKAHPLSGRLSVVKNEEAVYNRGILAVGATNDKGQMLQWLIGRPGFAKFSKIVFVDDKEKYVVSIEKAFSESGLQHDSFRYAAADERVRSFNVEIADAQTDYFESTGEIVSDEEVLEEYSAAAGQSLF